MAKDKFRGVKQARPNKPDADIAIPRKATKTQKENRARPKSILNNIIRHAN